MNISIILSKSAAFLLFIGGCIAFSTGYLIGKKKDTD